MGKANTCFDHPCVSLMPWKSYSVTGVMIPLEEAKGIERTMTVKSNKGVLKDYPKSPFIHPIVQSKGAGMVTFLKESLSEKGTKEIISKVISCIF